MRKISILKKLLVLSKVAGYRYILSTIIIFSLFILIPAVSYSSELWAARYSGPGNGQDEAAAIAVDADGNVYVTGNSFGTNETRLDYATIKYDADGNQQWVARYNGPGNKEDVAIAIAVHASGNVYVTGYSDGTGGYTYDYAT
ncbi:MAG TPA: SBBP repeat-containing protein, partial [Candidatus Brocadiaceae bacterium]|nr:SBBP repeat-containing protein [Candidatus Brocadiaceae bacterium]